MSALVFNLVSQLVFIGITNRSMGERLLIRNRYNLEEVTSLESQIKHEWITQET